MKTIKVRIKGTGMGLLLHNPAGMGASNGGKKVIPTAEQEAKAGRPLDVQNTSREFGWTGSFMCLTMRCISSLRCVKTFV
ncbi:MAG: hypothetical protein WB623_17495 [Candidatus Sulfotelmatobacter sp.]